MTLQHILKLDTVKLHDWTNEDIACKCISVFCKKKLFSHLEFVADSEFTDLKETVFYDSIN